MTLGTTGQVVAQSQSKAPPAQQASGGNLHGKVTPAERQAAADRTQGSLQASRNNPTSGDDEPGGTPDYFGTTPNLPTARSRR